MRWELHAWKLKRLRPIRDDINWLNATPYFIWTVLPFALALLLNGLQPRRTGIFGDSLASSKPPWSWRATHHSLTSPLSLFPPTTRHPTGWRRGHAAAARARGMGQWEGWASLALATAPPSPRRGATGVDSGSSPSAAMYYPCRHRPNPTRLPGGRRS